MNHNITNALKQIYRAKDCTDTNDTTIAIDQVKQLRAFVGDKPAVLRRLFSLQKKQTELTKTPYVNKLTINIKA